MYRRKSISPVVVIALLLVVAVVAIFGFQDWYFTFQSKILVNTEEQSVIDNRLEILNLNNDRLYLKSGSETNLTLLKVTDKDGNEMCSFSGTTTVNSSGIVGFWTFDKIINNSGTLTLPDYSGLGNDGILYDGNISNSDGNTTPKLVKSKLNNALDFDGIDDYVRVLHDDSLLSDNLTIIVYYSPDEYFTNDNNYSSILRKVPSYYFSFSRDSANTYPYFIFGFMTGPFQNNWYSGKLKLNEINLRYYQMTGFKLNLTDYSYFHNNNKIMDMQIWTLPQDPYAGPINSGTENLFFGTFGEVNRSKPNANQYRDFDGKIDEIRIYNRTLSDDEIETLYWYFIRVQQIGINQIDLSSCNLKRGSQYNIVVFTDKNKVEQTLIS